MLHTVVARGEKKHVPYAQMLLDAGARTDIRDELLKSTPLGWACRWGRVHFVKLLLERRADPLEADADPWAAALPAPQALPGDLVAEGHAIPIARVQAMHEGKRRARAQRGPSPAAE